MPKVESAKKTTTGRTGGGWGGGQLFGSEKTESTFQGAGFKDKDKALETIRLLDGRDITYAYQIINSMYNRAKVIHRRTTDKEKRKNLQEAVDTFEEWIEDYKTNSRSKENFSYLPLEVVEGFEALGEHYKLKTDFLKAYREVEGDLKALRGKKVPGAEVTWDVERNRRLKELEKEDGELYETGGQLSGLPTQHHLQKVLLAYSPDQSKLKKSIPLIKEKLPL